MHTEGAWVSYSWVSSRGRSLGQPLVSPHGRPPLVTLLCLPLHTHPVTSGFWNTERSLNTWCCFKPLWLSPSSAGCCFLPFLFLLESSVSYCSMNWLLPRSVAWPGSKISFKSLWRCSRCRFDPWVKKIPQGKWQSIPVFLLGKSHGRRSLVGYSPWGQKELDMTGHSTAQQIGESCLLFVVLCITVDSYAGERNNSEGSNIPFTSCSQRDHLAEICVIL